MRKGGFVIEYSLMFLANAIRDWNVGHFFMHPWFWSAFLGWILAQTIKMVRAAIRMKTFDFEYLVSTGGMPSAHTSMVFGLATSVGLTEGFGSPIAMVALAFASVTMFDAATVRRAAGEQAKVLNRIVRIWRQEHHMPSVANLKELLGHTRTEVFGGMATGIVTACVVCRFWR